MNKTDRSISTLLTGTEEIDNRLRQAFAIGIQHGQATDRDNVARSSKIDTTTRLLIAFIRTQKISLEEAMTAFDLPKADREIYRRIISQRKPKGTAPTKK